MGKEKRPDKGEELIDLLLEPAPETPEYKIFKQLTMEFDKVTHDAELLNEYAQKGQEILDSQTAEKTTQE